MIHFEMSGNAPVQHSCYAEDYHSAVSIYKQKFGVEPESVLMAGKKIYGVCAFCDGLLDGSHGISREIYGEKDGAQFHSICPGTTNLDHYKKLIEFRSSDPSWKGWCDEARKSVERSEKNSEAKQEKLPWYKRIFRKGNLI